MLPLAPPLDANPRLIKTLEQGKDERGLLKGDKLKLLSRAFQGEHVLDVRGDGEKKTAIY